MDELNIDQFKSVIHKINISEKNIENIIYHKYFFNHTKNYFDENLNIIDEFDDKFDDYKIIIEYLLRIYILIISQIHIYLENNYYKKNKNDYILTIYLMYFDFLNKNKVHFSIQNIYILYQTYLYFDKYKYSNNIYYLIYKRFISLSKTLLESNNKKINVNDFFKKNIILESLESNMNLFNFELEPFLF